MRVYDENDQLVFAGIPAPQKRIEDAARLATAAPLADPNQLELLGCNCADCERRHQARCSAINSRDYL